MEWVISYDMRAPASAREAADGYNPSLILAAAMGCAMLDLYEREMHPYLWRKR